MSEKKEKTKLEEGIEEDSSDVDLSKISFARLFEETIAKPLVEIKTDILHSILSLQKPEGGMELEGEVAAFLGIDVEEIEIAAEDIETEVLVDKFILLSTAVLLEVLEQRYSSKDSYWKISVQNSKDWLEAIIRNGKPCLYGKGLVEWTRDYIIEILI